LAPGLAGWLVVAWGLGCRQASGGSFGWEAVWAFASAGNLAGRGRCPAVRCAAAKARRRAGRVVMDSRPRGRGGGLTDRRAECRVLDQLLEAVRAGESRVLVVHGEPGVGKTAPLEYLAGRAAGCRVLRVAGVQSEMELLATAEAGPLDELQSARADWLRGQTAAASGQGSDAPPLLLKAARRLEPLDPGLARETYLDAW
jgi:AAA ATPase-like protein